MRKLIVTVLALALGLALLVPAQAAPIEGKAIPAEATNNTIVVSNSTGAPDAHTVRPAVYKIGGYNYFRLRDLAMILHGSAKQFAVDYAGATGTVLITSGKAYLAVGGELGGSAETSAFAAFSNDAVVIDGAPAAMDVYKIGGYNYFRLRDLGKALDFHVGYDDETKTVYISGARGYEEEPGDGSVPFTAQYIRTNGYHDGARYPAVTLIGSAEELQAYYEANKGLYDLSHKEAVYSDTTIGFADAIGKYDDAWFETHQLLLVLLEEGSGSVRHEVTKVTAGPEPAVEIDRLVPWVGTDDMAEWHILIETERVFDPADNIAVRLTAKEA